MSNIVMFEPGTTATKESVLQKAADLGATAGEGMDALPQLAYLAVACSTLARMMQSAGWSPSGFAA